jgi:hypothetical protein
MIIFKQLPYLFLAILWLASCTSVPNGQMSQAPAAATVFPTVVPMDISCIVAYRSSVSIPIESYSSITLSTENQNAEVGFKDLTFHGSYFNGSRYELRTLKLSVTPKDSEKEISSVLYQLSRTSKLINQIEEHGFTGLNYVYNPVSHSELQFWCKAE